MLRFYHSSLFGLPIHVPCRAALYINKSITFKKQYFEYNTLCNKNKLNNFFNMNIKKLYHLLKK